MLVTYPLTVLTEQGPRHLSATCTLSRFISDKIPGRYVLL